MKYLTVLFLVSATLALRANVDISSCLRPGKTSGPYDEWGFPADTFTPGDRAIQTASDEMDLIYSLLTYSIVFKTWQTDSLVGHPMRGQNYGAILVNPENELVHWGRNEVFSQRDETQHAETRAIQQFLRKSGKSNLTGYTIYVGGDSCPMCAGMISQQGIVRAVLGLSNPLFGKNFDRMNLDSRNCGNDNTAGLPPVARQVLPVMSSSEIRKDLDRAFRQEIVKSCGGSQLKGCKTFPSQTDFLKSEAAFEIFEKASKQFARYQLKFPKDRTLNSQRTNAQLYSEAVSFLKMKAN
jgi:tRNA(Arg) A34 adenosine deaminase TadA